MMAKGASNCLFLSLLLLLTICSSAEFTAKVEESLEKQIFRSSRRQLLNNVKKTTQHDMIFPLLNPTPTVITVPSTLPVNTPAPIPTTTPATVPSTNPNNPTAPITNPVTTPAPIAVPGGGVGVGAGGQQPVTNPVTTYPTPTGGVPVSTPVTNPLPPPATMNPPATTNAPAVSGQSWCVARTGAPEASLQSALDYACGMGGADCSQIQQGANCYNPNTMQNHASYAFNSYYQKNRSPTSCDFGGAATIVNTNPSSGSCIFPSSGSQSTQVAQPATVATPATPATTSSTLPGTGIPGSVTPPSLLNSSIPNTGSDTTNIFGPETPPSVNTSTSMSVGLQPSFSCIILLIMTSSVARFILESSILV